ncbi:MAG: hypothetical protein HYZ02_01320, partial [Candidatus Levybacteria bacterium]|nr:hypothetical protein [Candidatus Levybacteria bacterium]
KVIAAHRAGLKTVIMPKDNKKELEDVPKEVLKDLRFVFVSHMDEVLDLALSKPSPRNKLEHVAISRSILHAPAPYPVD